MTKQDRSRREFLADAGLAAAAALCPAAALHPAAACAAQAQSQEALHLAINQWSVGAIRARDKDKAAVSFDAELAGLAAAGIHGLEPGLHTPDQAEKMAAQLAKHGLHMRSVYTGSAVHDPKTVDEEARRIVELGKRVKAAGTKILVTNPSPLSGREPKNDKQLRTQAAALDRIGRELASLGLVLAYHNHDIELAHAAREFHHMMVGTEPGCLSLCLDAHWVYRGAGNSQVALFDVVKLYGPRVVELHLRQSTGNIWSETFGDGDIDYRALTNSLLAAGVRPLLVLEQGPERGTPQTMEVAEVHRRSARYARDVFACLGPAKP